MLYHVNIPEENLHHSCHYETKVAEKENGIF
jgi:hypothetical protein